MSDQLHVLDADDNRIRSIDLTHTSAGTWKLHERLTIQEPTTIEVEIRDWANARLQVNHPSSIGFIRGIPPRPGDADGSPDTLEFPDQADELRSIPGPNPDGTSVILHDGVVPGYTRLPPNERRANRWAAFSREELHALQRGDGGGASQLADEIEAELERRHAGS
jgi:hypothetical protein